MSAVVIVSIGASVGLFVFFVARRKWKTQGTWLQFFAKGKDEGFTFKEIELLRRLAVKSNLADPASLFWSQNQLDVCIRSLVRINRISGGDQDENTQDFLSKLYDFRKKIEMQKPRMKSGISSSRQIGEHQFLRVSVKEKGVFRSQVMGNHSQHLAIARPEGGKIPPDFGWAGQRISVYFWREDDAGYVFDTGVMEEIQAEGKAALKIAHSESLFRTQKRKSIRVKLHKPAFLYPLSGEPGKLEAAPGLRCFVEDISETGYAVIVGGKASPGIRVKIQFSLDNLPVSMGGTVRSVEYKGPEVNRSLLHVEADPLAQEVRNRILGEVFGMLPDDEEDLPFRLLDEEAESMAGQSNSSGSAV